MTYNPTLFIALVLGYFIGDLIFHREAEVAVGDDAGGCH
jgi:hypothetical protein